MSDQGATGAAAAATAPSPPSKGKSGAGGGGGPAPSRKESILELQKFMDATVRVQCIGGRQMEGTLRGFDDLVNLVLDDCEEFVRG